MNEKIGQYPSWIYADTFVRLATERAITPEALYTLATDLENPVNIPVSDELSEFLSDMAWTLTATRELKL